MPRLVTSHPGIVNGVLHPRGRGSRVFGLSCKAAAGIGVADFAYSPPLGKEFWLLFVGIHYCGATPADFVMGNIYISFGVGVPTGGIIATQWEILIPFWAGTTKPAIMVIGIDQFLSFPMSRLFKQQALRFGLSVENGSATRPFWVDAWFQISEG